MYVCMPAGLAVCMCIALRCIVFVSVSVSVLYCLVLCGYMCTYMWLSSIVIAECSMVLGIGAVPSLGLI